jgi:DNA-binding FrmR family transcriptional regulator
MTATASVVSTRQRVPGNRHETDILSRLRKAAGQLTGIATMYDDGRYCIDILDQLAAVNAAVDAVALILLEDHMNSCVRDAVAHGNADEKVAELAAAIRRYVRSR